MPGGSLDVNDGSHIAHQRLVNAIQKLWSRLNRRGNQKMVKMQNEIKRNQKTIADLTRENLFELDVNFHD